MLTCERASEDALLLNKNAGQLPNCAVELVNGHVSW